MVSTCYYGAVKGTSFKWLDIRKLCQLLLPKHQIAKIKYFTARVSARPGDPDQPTRQQTFLRALATLPNFEVIYGHFLTNEVSMLQARLPPGSPPKYVKVIKTEEKGSDVNLATHLLRDGFRKDYEAAVLVTNDSDLLEPVRIVRKELGLVSGFSILTGRRAGCARGKASFVKQIRPAALRASQFPIRLRDAHGVITKPPIW
ncbi:MAG: NYN domain-containing protein [bacterium]